MTRSAGLVGYGAWFMLAFIVGTYLTFPLDDMKPLIVGLVEEQLGKGKQGVHGVDPKVELGALSLSGFGVKAERVMIQLASRNPDPGPSFDFEELAVGVRPWSLLGKATTVTFDADLYGGSADGVLSIDDKGNVHDADIDVDGIDLSKILLVQAKVGVPIGGKLDLRAELDLGLTPEKTGSGDIELELENATSGPGNLKLAAIFGGFQIPAVSVGNLNGVIPIKLGKGTLTGVKLDGKDVQAELIGDITFKPKFLTSRLDIDGWFALTPAFLERERKFQALLDLGGASLANAKDGDGHYWFALKGALQNPGTSLSRDGGKRAKQKASRPTTKEKDNDEEKPFTTEG
jgi:type II secretion system protein N